MSRKVDEVIVYNELVAVTAGAGLLGFASFLANLLSNKRIDSEGWAAFFGLTGLLLLATGLHTTVTWPFGGDGFEYANIAFGQPAAGFGALLLLAPCGCGATARSSTVRSTAPTQSRSAHSSPPASSSVRWVWA